MEQKREFKSTYQLQAITFHALVDSGKSFSIRARATSDGESLKLVIDPKVRQFTLDVYPSISHTEAVCGLSISELKFWASYCKHNGFTEV